MPERKGPNGNVPVPQILWQGCDQMMVIDENRRILAMNPAMERLMGRCTLEAIGGECGQLLKCRDFQRCPMPDRPTDCPGLQAMRQHRPVKCAEYLIRTATGRVVPVSASYTPIRSRPGGPMWALVVLRDITTAKRRERSLAKQAMTDPLTGLANRRQFLIAADAELKRAARHRRPLALAIVDVDGFKAYNDAYGHLAGDGLLKSIAHLLQTHHRAEELVARYGGDEMALLLPETDAAGAMVFAERLRQLVEQFPFAHYGPSGAAGTEVPITISIGVAAAPQDGATTKELFAMADERLFDAKESGRNQIAGPESQIEESEPPKDHRRQERAPIQVPLLLRSLKERSQWSLHRGTMRDLSNSGVCFRAPKWKAIRRGEELMLSFALPSKGKAPTSFSRWTGRAKVVRVEEVPGVGAPLHNDVLVAASLTDDAETSLAGAAG